jgi:Fur family transcriptional regulator, ferric uptake regulator
MADATGDDGRGEPRSLSPGARDAWETFVAFLRARPGARVTEARRRVLEAALRRHDHFRADDLASEVSSGAERVSRGTVYRTLALMVEAGLVREIRDADVHVHYEHVHGHAYHEHLICDRCGGFFEFEDKSLGERLEKVCRLHGFRHRAHRVVIFGVCRACLDAEGPGPDEDTGPPREGP